jgi:catechol 2,3-dioxygenase-like lactoylglutathione lyase family enzyme
MQSAHEFSVRLRHLALPSRDVLTHQAFYVQFFGFRQVRGDGFLTNDEGFVLVLDPAAAVTTSLPETFHFGFQAPAAQVRALYQRMVADQVTIDQHLETTGGVATFYCRDPHGWQVEVRSVPGSD